MSQIIELTNSLCFDVTCFFGDKSSKVYIEGNIKYISSRMLCKFYGAPLLVFGNLKLLYYGARSDLIIFQEPFPLLWPAISILRNVLKRKVLVLIHADPSAHKYVKSFYGLFRSIVFRGATCVTTSPNLQRKVWSSLYKKNEVIPLCLPDTPRADSHVELDIPEKYALYVGRLANYKGIDVLIHAALRMPHVKFVIAGDGPLSPIVSKAVSSVGADNIKFINRFVSEEEKVYLIVNSCFVVFPSTSENEAFGLVQLEAMRSGKPLINTDLDTGVNFVAPNMVCAVTAKANDVESLLSGIEQLWESSSLVDKLGRQGKLRYEEFFSSDSFKSSWVKTIKECFIG